MLQIAPLNEQYGDNNGAFGVLSTLCYIVGLFLSINPTFYYTFILHINFTNMVDSKYETGFLCIRSADITVCRHTA